jgi:hypothetical protein
VGVAKPHRGKSEKPFCGSRDSLTLRRRKSGNALCALQLAFPPLHRDCALKTEN